MSREVKLFKKNAPWTDKDGVVHNGKNLYVLCGDMMIPIRIPNFSTDDKPDSLYRARRAVFEAFAEELPVREDQGAETSMQEHTGEKAAVPGDAGKNEAPDGEDDGDIPF